MEEVKQKYCQEGLSIREYFAAKAMQGICVNAGRNGHNFHKANELAKEAIKIADAATIPLAVLAGLAQATAA